MVVVDWVPPSLVDGSRGLGVTVVDVGSEIIENSTGFLHLLQGESTEGGFDAVFSDGREDGGGQTLLGFVEELVDESKDFFGRFDVVRGSSSSER